VDHAPWVSGRDKNKNNLGNGKIINFFKILVFHSNIINFIGIDSITELFQSDKI